jgi:thiol-disulfide isomerase/thioredoxin
MIFCALVLALVAQGQPSAAAASVAADARSAVAAGDLSRAASLVTSARAGVGETPDVIEAMAVVAVGALNANDLARALDGARQARQLAVRALAGRNVDSDAHLAIAIATAIEVEAQSTARRGDRTAALALLNGELATYLNTSIHKKIQKNINLLTLEGHPAPSLELAEYIGPKPPTFNQLKGKVVLLFFWAHWCPDCKAESPILADIAAKYQSHGLVIVAPTQRYGYVANGAAAAPDEELKYIVTIRDTYYRFLATVPVPVSEANHKQYGVSSTPTLVVLDQQGVVRMYHPGRMSAIELERVIEPLLPGAQTHGH